MLLLPVSAFRRTYRQTTPRENFKAFFFFSIFSIFPFLFFIPAAKHHYHSILHNISMIFFLNCSFLFDPLDFEPWNCSYDFYKKMYIWIKLLADIAAQWFANVAIFQWTVKNISGLVWRRSTRCMWTDSKPAFPCHRYQGGTPHHAIVFSIGLHRISGLFYIRYPAGYPARKTVVNFKKEEIRLEQNIYQRDCLLSKKVGPIYIISKK